MKKSFLLLMFTITAWQAQAQYNFVNSTATFQPLTGGVNAAAGIVWDDEEFNVPIGFSFKAFGKTYDSLVIESNGGFILHNGIANGSVFWNQDTLPYFSAMGEDLVTKGNSPILYQVQGSAGSRVLTVEYRNAGFYSDATGTDVINFQVRFYETSGTIEMHYGPSSAPANTYFPSVGLFLYDLFNGTQQNIQFLDGVPSNPTFMNNFSGLADLPANGRLYRFTDIYLSASPGISEKKKLKVYPNPAKDFITIEFPEGDAGKFSIVDMTGKVIRECVYEPATRQVVELKSLPAGVYFIRMQSGFTSRLVIQ